MTSTLAVVYLSAVPSSNPVNVPRRQTSTSEEHSVGNTSQAASAERSLLSKQIRLNSDNSLSQMSNGGAAHLGGSSGIAEAQVGSSCQNLAPLPKSNRESADDRGIPIPNGVPHGAPQNGPLPEGFDEQASAESQSHMKRVPSMDWQSHASKKDQQHGQVSLQVTCCKVHCNVHACLHAMCCKIMLVCFTRR